MVLLLAACGGGGSDAPATVAPVTSFALQAGYKARVSGGSTDNFTVSGSCSGTAAQTTGKAIAALFEGVAGFSATTTFTLNLTNCTPATSASTAVGYYDANYSPLGVAIQAGEYSKFLAAPAALPTAVKVGDTAVYATLTNYSDSTKATSTGQSLYSYVVEADSLTTAFVTIISKKYNTSNQLLTTSLQKFRIAGDGSLTLVSLDIQASTTSTVHLLYTKV